MRLARKIIWLCALIAGSLAPLAVRAQNPDTIAPEESEARARKVIDQLIQGFGDPPSWA